MNIYIVVIVICLLLRVIIFRLPFCVLKYKCCNCLQSNIFYDSLNDSELQVWTLNVRLDRLIFLSLSMLPKSHRNAILFELPTILEQAIKNILEDTKPESYQKAGNGPRTTIILRFRASMADLSVSPLHPSTSQSFYRCNPRARREETEKG